MILNYDLTQDISGLQHKGAMSAKKIAKMRRSYVPLCGHTTFVLLTLARTMTIIDKIMIFCNDVNNTCTSIGLLFFYLVLVFKVLQLSLKPG